VCSAAVAPIKVDPIGQSLHIAADGVSTYFPDGHTKHLLASLCKSADVPGSVKYVPAGQSVQVASVDDGEYFPAGQTVQVVAPVDAVIDPVAHV